MATAIFMPKAGMAMEEGTLIRWLKNVGEHVEMNEPVMEIETDKITMESEAPATGILLATLVEEGDTVPVLQTIGWIGQQGEAVPADDVPEADAGVADGNDSIAIAHDGESPRHIQSTDGISATPYAKTLIMQRNLDASAIQPTGKHGEIVAADVLALCKAPKSTPVAARIADNEGISLSGIDGSGSGGRIMKDDVLSALSGKATGQAVSAPGETRQRLSGMRRIIADRMMRSYSEIPSVTQDTDMDVTELLSLRQRINEGRDMENRISVNDFMLRAVALASVKYPEFRTRLEDDDLVTSPDVHLGMAVSTEGGLLVPVIRHADRLLLSALSAAAKDLAGRARGNKLQPDELTGSTLSVSNLGMFGVGSFTPIINQPNPAIVGVCCIRDELALNDANELYKKKVMRVSVTFDHRIMDGAVAASFALYVKELLENPLDLLV